MVKVGPLLIVPVKPAVPRVSEALALEREIRPLEIEVLYQGYQLTAAFAVASLLALLALLTLFAKTLLEQRGTKVARD